MSAPAPHRGHVLEERPLRTGNAPPANHANDIAPMSLMTYAESKPWAAAIKDAVCSTRCSPEGGIRTWASGFETIRL